MIFKKFDFTRDHDRCIRFLTECYRENGNITCWLPQRFDDFFFRIGSMERHKQSVDLIFVCEEKDQIVGLILPDDNAMNSCIKKGHEHIFPEMVAFAERNLAPLLKTDENGAGDFFVVSHDSLTYQADFLQKRGYTKQVAQDYDNVFHPLTQQYQLEFPKGFRLSYGEDLDETMKAEACHYGFHPENDDGILTHRIGDIIPSFQARKKSHYFKDSFESLITTDNGDICSYSFCYVDKDTQTGFVEPVSTREKYRHKGLCKLMILGIMMRLKEMKIPNAYINSYDWRRKVYNACGFKTEDSIGYWCKKIHTR